MVFIVLIGVQMSLTFAYMLNKVQPNGDGHLCPIFIEFART